MKILKLGAFLTSLVDMHVIVSMEPQVRYELDKSFEFKFRLTNKERTAKSVSCSITIGHGRAQQLRMPIHAFVGFKAYLKLAHI